MKTDSYYITGRRLIIEVIWDQITIEGMIAAREAEIAKGWIQHGVNTLVVVQARVAALSPSDLKIYMDWSAEHLAALEGSKTAIVVDTPAPTAMSNFFQNVSSKVRLMEVFSTLSAAANWLNVPMAEILDTAPDAQKVGLPRRGGRRSWIRRND